MNYKKIKIKFERLLCKFINHIKLEKLLKLDSC